MLSLKQAAPPKTARAKRAVAEREPKNVENPKTSLFLRGTTCSQVVQDCLADLFALRQPLSKKFTKKNAIHPFEDPTSLEFFSEKNDASILLFGSSSKKRPHTITITRTFAAKTLDMLELHVDPQTLRTLKQFKGRKPAVGSRPMILFAGARFESPVDDEYVMAKNMFLDFFRCEGGSSEDTGKVDVEGLQYIVSITCDDPTSIDGTSSTVKNGASTDVSKKPTIRLRVYTVRTKRSGNARLPRVELEEMGPRMDFRVGRCREPDAAMLKQAMKKGKTPVDEKTKKNVSTDSMGDKLGRIHLGKQDLKEMSIRKFAGLKRSRDVEGGIQTSDGSEGQEEDDDDEDSVDADGSMEAMRKRRRK